MIGSDYIRDEYMSDYGDGYHVLDDPDGIFEEIKNNKIVVAAAIGVGYILYRDM